VPGEAGCDLAYAGPESCAAGRERAFPALRAVVLLIVDAIRFDFAPEFPTIARSLRDAPDRARLFQFVADAPTTTMQRLTGLTTGGLPTIVDMGRSFDAGIDVQEDNWVVQSAAAGVRMSVLGDDTWLSLFPAERWAHSAPYPSLNVKDIDGCDEHVARLLPRELAATAALPAANRSLTIGPRPRASPAPASSAFSTAPRRSCATRGAGHFLGVDHIGHRYGINHAQMRAKARARARREVRRVRCRQFR
jgi:phosphatidylinositol glycan class O